jgi:hypothetical protein
MSDSVDLVNDIVTSYGVQVFNVERVIAEYGHEMTEAALVAVRALPYPPESPFGWMISQLRAGKIQARHFAAAEAGGQMAWLAARYCKGQHDPGVDTAQKRRARTPLAPELEALLREKGIERTTPECAACGNPVAMGVAQ